eukprot:396434-Rhodomonas_salina.1
MSLTRNQNTCTHCDAQPLPHVVANTVAAPQHGDTAFVHKITDEKQKGVDCSSNGSCSVSEGGNGAASLTLRYQICRATCHYKTVHHTSKLHLISRCTPHDRYYPGNLIFLEAPKPLH